MLNVINDYSWEGLPCIVDTSLSGQLVVRKLAAIGERRRLPRMLGSGLVDQSQKMTVAARAIADKKTVGQLL